MTEAVVTALVRHWHHRPDRDALIAAAVQHRAIDHLAHERREIASLQAELVAVQTERAAARRRSCQLAGLIRRQPQPAAPHPDPVKLPLTTVGGSPLGTVTVREREVNALPGRVVYEVSGPRIRPGLVTLGPDIYGCTPVPEGFYACWGRPTNSDWFTRERTGMPTINRVTMTGGWSYRGSGDVRTAETPTRGPGPTAERAGAILRAVAIHFLSRPDLSALRISAGKQDAARRRAALAEGLGRLRAREARLRRRLRTHQARQEHFAALVPPVEHRKGAQAA
ncbi:hypothetical protein [Streptomyces noursei]|uniref:hypothetical protein n=1 Tax=Streptomyces noursei TaxID=1971 RepID=UPI001677D914|nr:hypothetical protein [Streptomyces noursei]MCZ1021365.1 hypothetical protein [Streptomyces noursei]GGX54480.1 hypothetical protein GCM10010341_89500 [Streptomyces noursei]